MVEYDVAAAELAGSEDFSVGFLCALVSEELINCETVLKECGWSLFKDQQAKELSTFAINKWKKTIDRVSVVAYSMAINEMGQVSAAVETFVFLTRCEPSLVFLTGIAGSLQREKVLKCDVVVANNVTFRTQDKVSGKKPDHIYRPRDHRINGYSSDFSRNLQRFFADKYPFRNRIDHSDHANWNVHCSGIYTWDYVLSSPDIVERLNADYSRAACVEMEGGGFLTAIERYSQIQGRQFMKGFIVKGISDYAESKDSELSVRAAASRNSAQVAVGLAEWLLKKKNNQLLMM